jgi:predicted glycosyltransferase
MPDHHPRVGGGGRALPRAAPGLGERGGLRVALYSHDTMGIGHVRRNLLIGQALAAAPLSASVLLVAGAREAGLFALPPGVDCVTVPALYKGADGRYQPRSLGLSLAELIDLRGRAIAAALRAFAPDVLIVDKEPRGALGELEPALEALRGRARCVLGLRDVLDEPATVRREWASAGNEAAVREHYDAVWVYGDPAVYDVVRECRLGAAVRSKATYTGYLNPGLRVRDQHVGDEGSPPPGPFVLCTVGGGQDGARLAEAFARAELPGGTGGVIVAGPHMPAEARERLRRLAADRPRLRVMDFAPEPCRLLRRADRVVAMGGYNTVCEALAFGRPALVVPRVTPRREQLIRAERLRELGLLDFVHPDELSPAAVSRWLAAVPPRPRARVDLGGTERLPGLVSELLGRRKPRAVAAPSLSRAEVNHVAH